jgi:hypothetical protein
MFVQTKNIMRFRNLLFITLLFCFICNPGLRAQSNSIVGYIEKGDSIEFVFGQQHSITIGTTELILAKRINEIRQVNVAGDFNGWDPASAEFQLSKADGTLFKITLPRRIIGKTGEVRQFKFVLNHRYWVEPCIP